MKLIRLGRPAGFETLRIESSQPRGPGPGEVLVRVVAASLNFHDYAVISGIIPTAEGRVPLSDAAGEVVAVGGARDGVADAGWCIGDRVMSTFFPRWIDGPVEAGSLVGVPGDHVDGFAAEYVTVNGASLTRQPHGYSHAQASTLPCAALTAWRALMVDGPVRAGDTVLVQGTGGVSVFALQFAKATGATVIATSSSDTKLARLRALGADHLINYRSEPQWARAVAEITRGTGVDHVVEVGGAGTLAQSLRACRVGGHVAMIGVLSGREGPVSTAMLMAKNIRLQGVTVGSHRHQRQMVRAIEATGVQPVIHQHFQLNELAAAFALQKAGDHVGKIVVDVA